VGALKICAAFVFLVGIGIPEIVLPAVVVVTVLMAGAVAMHFKIGDPIKKALPASAMLTMCLTLLVLKFY